MSTNTAKRVQSCSASPARAGAGDVATRGLLRERRATPPARIHPVNPKKLFSTPVSKFTGRRAAPSPNLARIRSCLEEYRNQTTATPSKVYPKAASMEDLTPSKRVKKESTDLIHSPYDMNSESEMKVKQPSTSRSGARAFGGAAQAQAAARVARFMLLAAWRKRKDELVNLRKTLDSKRSCSERLRVQVWALKSLLDADNAKVALAMRELERLKQLLRDKDLERAVLEREKNALEKDVSAAEDRVSELIIGLRNSRNEVEEGRARLAAGERRCGEQRAAAQEARRQRDHAYTRINLLEEELSQREALLQAAEQQLAALRADAGRSDRLLALSAERLRIEQEARSRAEREAEALRAQLAARERELRAVAEQLAWWPRPLTRMLGAARSWFRHPMSLSEAIVWSLIPARHGC